MTECSEIKRNNGCKCKAKAVGFVDYGMEAKPRCAPHIGTFVAWILRTDTSRRSVEVFNLTSWTDEP